MFPHWSQKTITQHCFPLFPTVSRVGYTPFPVFFPRQEFLFPDLRLSNSDLKKRINKALFHSAMQTPREIE